MEIYQRIRLRRIAIRLPSALIDMKTPGVPGVFISSDRRESPPVLDFVSRTSGPPPLASARIPARSSSLSLGARSGSTPAGAYRQ